ncbi:putative N-acetyl transferase, GNAT family [Carnobacterium sp. 17-4]|uniref:GNAT family N-acetyltransferase n=1 Tax=Carnobacterium sp. (strain 17-4) TaxID=208596 RepID=UPI0002058CFA|nr:GNAT family N-acetyltransferase [Carnobacterium sp. 17-4]AEB30165.1 putative N-acetyl transferase, GNAT family [Carnobacterium sp. 17-4]
MKYDYRLIREDEINQIVKIRDYCFRYQYTGNYLEDFLHWAKICKTIGAFDGEKLAGQVMVFPLNMTIHHQPFVMGGISFVATYPEYRNAGVMKHLLIRCLEEMRKQGQLISVLGPFSVSFYRHFGWDLFFDKVHYTFPIDLFNTKKGDMGHLERFSYTENREQLELVKELYHTYALQTNGMMIRNEDWWKRLELRQPDASFALSIAEDGQPQGYIRYIMNGQTFEVLDQVALNLTAEQALWEFIKVHRSNFTQVTGTAAVHQSFGTQWDDPQFKKEIVHDKMIRIVDVERFLAVYPFQGLTKRLYLKVRDAFAPWNEGVYRIDSKEVTRVSEKDVSLDECLMMDISSLSSYLVGYHALKWYQYQGKASGSEHVLKEWDKVIPKNQPQFYGHF